MERQTACGMHGQPLFFISSAKTAQKQVFKPVLTELALGGSGGDLKLLTLAPLATKP